MWWLTCIIRINPNCIRMSPNKELVYPELSYKIVGILFKVHTSLGGYHQEKYYQRAIRESFKECNMVFNEEISVDLYFEGKPIGNYRFDFLVENKIVLELKALPRLRQDDFRRMLAYLKSRNLELGILANFRGDKLKYHRVLNSSAPDYLHRIRKNSD